MAVYLRAVTTISTASGLSTNVVVWNTHWKEDVASINRDTAATQILARLDNLVSQLTPTSSDNSLCLASYMLTTAAHTDVYDLTEPKPRVAFAGGTTGSTTVQASVGQNLPSEVALCVSYQSTRLSGQPQNRRRGRIYIGPLQVNHAGGSAAVDLDRPTQAQTDTMVNRVRTSLQPGTVGEVRFCVLSRQTWAGLAIGEKPPPDPNTGQIVFPEIPQNLPAAMNNVVEFWCDNEWDTQRRRGLGATARSTQAPVLE